MQSGLPYVVHRPNVVPLPVAITLYSVKVNLFIHMRYMLFLDRVGQSTDKKANENLVITKIE